MSKVNVAGLERATQEVNTISQSDIYFLLTYGIKESEVVPCLKAYADMHNSVPPKRAKFLYNNINVDVGKLWDELKRS